MQKVERFEGNYFQWLKEELSGWDRLPWAVFGGGVGFQLAILLLIIIRQKARDFSHGMNALT